MTLTYLEMTYAANIEMTTEEIIAWGVEEEAIESRFADVLEMRIYDIADAGGYTELPKDFRITKYWVSGVFVPDRVIFSVEIVENEAVGIAW